MAALNAALSSIEDIKGVLKVVHLPSGKYITATTDRLFGQYRNLLIVSNDGEAAFYGAGWLCKKLPDIFGGQGQGSFATAGFWRGRQKNARCAFFLNPALVLIIRTVGAAGWFLPLY